ncbi:hypothetical protein CBA19C8_33530 [Paraburkholderia terrae]|nr:hypothetical protein CBA19C8_33530 [Paraburkholderia terrae]
MIQQREDDDAIFTPGVRLEVQRKKRVIQTFRSWLEFDHVLTARLGEESNPVDLALVDHGQNRRVPIVVPSFTSAMQVALHVVHLRIGKKHVAVVGKRKQVGVRDQFPFVLVKYSPNLGIARKLSHGDLITYHYFSTTSNPTGLSDHDNYDTYERE